MSYTKITKTPFERAEPVGKALLQQCKEEREYRKKWSDREIGQSAKEAATYLAGQARGRVSFNIDPNDWERIFGKGKK